MYPSGFFSTMSRRVAAAIHWFLIAQLVFPGVLARPNKQHPKGVSDGSRWNAAPKNHTTTWKVESSGSKTQRIATYKENLRPSKRGQRSLFLENEYESPLPVYQNPNTNPKLDTPSYPDDGSGFSSIGSGFPVTGNAQPITGGNIAGIPNGQQSTGINIPGLPNGQQSTGINVPGLPNPYSGVGEYPGTGNGYPGNGISFTGVGPGYQDFPQSPQLGFPNLQGSYPIGGNPGSNWYPGPQTGYQSPIPGFPPFSPYGGGNATLAANSPYSPLPQYTQLNPIGDVASYSPSLNIPNQDFSGLQYGAQVQTNFAQNAPVFPGYSPYGVEMPPAQAAPYGVMPNPQGLASPEINPAQYANLLPCQVLCCLLSLCHLFSLPPCTSCENLSVQGQVPAQTLPASRAASSPKVVSNSGREAESIGAAPSKDVTSVTANQSDLPKPLDTSRSMPKPTPAAPIPSVNLSLEPPTRPSESSGGSIAAGTGSVPPTGPDKPDVKTAINALPDAETPQQVKQPSAPVQEQPQMAKAVRSLEITPPPQPSTSEKTDPRVVAATRSLT